MCYLLLLKDELYMRVISCNRKATKLNLEEWDKVLVVSMKLHISKPKRFQNRRKAKFPMSKL